MKKLFLKSLIAIISLISALCGIETQQTINIHNVGEYLDSKEKDWKIGGKIHFEEQNAAEYIGIIEINDLTRKTIKGFFNIQIDLCAHNAKALLKKENDQIILSHYEEQSKPGIGEEIHATLLYTSKRVEDAHHTLRDIYDNLRQVDASLPQNNAPTVQQVANAYHKIIKPEWKFQIVDVEFISGKTKNGGIVQCIIANLRIDGRDEIVNKEGKPISGNFLHLTLANVDSSMTEETEKMQLVTSKLKDILAGKMVKIANKNGIADLEFGVSGSAERVRPSLGLSEIKVVVFDWGDVLVSAHYEKLYGFLQRTFSFSSAELKMALTDFEKYMSGGGREENFWQNLASQRRVTLPYNWFSEIDRAKLDCLELKKEMFELVKKLKNQGLKVVVFSNITKENADLLRKYGYYDIFDDAILSCEIGCKKPNSEAYEILLSRVKAIPSECCFIDDKEENVIKAKEMGIQGIVFKSVEDLQDQLPLLQQ